MKSKIIFRSAASLLIALVVFSMIGFAPDSNADTANGVLTVKHNTLANGSAVAFGSQGYYVGTITGAKTTFVNMPAGSYTISICGSFNGVNYFGVVNRFIYNGGDQSTSMSLPTGVCNDQ